MEHVIDYKVKFSFLYRIDNTLDKAPLTLHRTAQTDAERMEKVYIRSSAFMCVCHPFFIR